MQGTNLPLCKQLLDSLLRAAKDVCDVRGQPAARCVSAGNKAVKSGRSMYYFQFQFTASSHSPVTAVINFQHAISTQASIALHLCLTETGLIRCTMLAPGPDCCAHSSLQRPCLSKRGGHMTAPGTLPPVVCTALQSIAVLPYLSPACIPTSR